MAASWASSYTCLAAMDRLVRLFDENYLGSLSFLLEDVLKLIVQCIQHELEAVARIGVNGFKSLVICIGRKATAEAWARITETILQLFDDSMPTKLLRVQPGMTGDLPFRQQDVVTQCVIHLLLIDTVEAMVANHYETISAPGIMTLLDALQRSVEFAQKFNPQIQLRQTLKALGFMREMKQLPGLLKQEREALSCSLKMLFRVMQDTRMQQGGFEAQASARLNQLCCSVLKTYIEKERQLRERPPPNPADPNDALVVEIEREVAGLVLVISDVILQGLKEMRPAQFRSLSPGLFPLLCDLVAVNSSDIRFKVREILLVHVSPFLAESSST
jgi:hypothetical protein